MLERALPASCSIGIHLRAFTTPAAQSVLVVEPKPSANLVAEPPSAMVAYLRNKLNTVLYS